MRTNRGSRVYSRYETAESYDATRFSSDAGILLDSIERNIVAELAPRTSKEYPIADIGAGTGRFAMGMMRLGFRVLASDASLAMLLTTRRRLQRETPNRLDLARGDIYNLPMKSDSFPYVVCIHVLNQLGHIEDQVEAIRELIRVCAPGGRVVFDVYNRTSLAMLAPSPKAGLVSLPILERRLAEMEDVSIDQVVGRFLIPFTAFRLTPAPFHGGLDNLDRVASTKATRFVTKAYYCLAKGKT